MWLLWGQDGGEHLLGARGAQAWRSGAVSSRQIERVKVGAWAPRTDDRVLERIRALAPLHPVAEIVELLNQEGLRSAQGRAFREHHVLYLARRHKTPFTPVHE